MKEAKRLMLDSCCVSRMRRKEAMFVSWLHRLLQYGYIFRSSNVSLLKVPRVHYKKTGEATFCFYGPKLWNIPFDLTTAFLVSLFMFYCFIVFTYFNYVPYWLL